MINSVVDLCNMALSRLGEERITALPPGDDSEAAKEAQLHYAQTRDEVLEDHPWRCAVHYQSLASLSDSDPGYLPQTEYDYQYTLPTDPYCLLPLLEDRSAVCKESHAQAGLVRVLRGAKLPCSFPRQEWPLTPGCVGKREQRLPRVTGSVVEFFRDLRTSF